MPQVPVAGLGRPSFRRRQLVLLALAAAAIVSFVLALLASRGVLWGLQIITDALLVSYVGALVHLRNAAAARAMDLRALGG